MIQIVSIGAFLIASAFPAAASTSSPAPAPSVAPATLAEAPAVTAAAKSTYAQLASGTLDRSKLTPEVNNAITDSLAQTISQQLGSLGKPQWQFFKRVSTPKGEVSVYRLSWPTVTLDYQFGLNEKGQVWALMLTPERPQ